jgi:hypothetical protein
MTAIKNNFPHPSTAPLLDARGFIVPTGPFRGRALADVPRHNLIADILGDGQIHPLVREMAKVMTAKKNGHGGSGHA